MTGKTKTFRDYEHEGWNAKAESWHADGGKITIHAIPPLLESVGLKPGMRVLEIACGPGYGAAAAAKAGAQAIGVDFAANMIDLARKLHPEAEFALGDAEALDMPDNSFDAVICPFGILHFPNPDKAIAEANRVLRPGGRYAFTVWSLPGKHLFFQTVGAAAAATGASDASLPEAPPMFRFSEAEECKRVMEWAGFTDVTFEEMDLPWNPATPEEFVDFIGNSTVRAAMMISLQSVEIQQQIRAVLLEKAAAVLEEHNHSVPWPAVFVAGTKAAAAE